MAQFMQAGGFDCLLADAGANQQINKGFNYFFATPLHQFKTEQGPAITGSAPLQGWIATPQPQVGIAGIFNSN